MIEGLVLSSLLTSFPVSVGKERPKLISFYQENCSACAKQFEEFECLEKKGYSIDIIGIGEDKVALKKHARKLSKSLRDAKAFLSWQEAKALGFSGTPSAILLETGGREKVFQGVLVCEKS